MKFSVTLELQLKQFFSLLINLLIVFSVNSFVHKIKIGKYLKGDAFRHEDISFTFTIKTKIHHIENGTSYFFRDSSAQRNRLKRFICLQQHYAQSESPRVAVEGAVLQ